tara:strand:+ start:1037 stop:1249 length:213 start_codon:yes stop_codon:yes gene_type:complete
MSRSRRKTPIRGIAAESDKLGKRKANRRLRRVNRTRREPKLLREVSDPWDMAKDGKKYFDTSEWPEGMRK